MAKTAVAVQAKPQPKPISVRQRRIAEGRRNQARVSNVALTKQPVPMDTRWFNTESSDDRIAHAQDVLGWVPVLPSEIPGGLPQGAMHEHEGKVTRSGGREILMKMPAAEYQQIKLSREQKQDREMKSTAKMRQRVADQVSGAGHDAAADRVMGSGLEIQEFDAETPDRVELES